jgi:hypothetical protein
MFIEGIKALAADEKTRVIVLVSKPPHPSVLEKVAGVIKDIKKPIVAILIGGDPEVMKKAGAIPALDLEQAGLIAVALSRGEDPEGFKEELEKRAAEIKARAAEEAGRMKEGQKYLRGLFSGGTLCDETQIMFKQEIGPVYSPAPVDPAFKLDNVWKSRENTVVDLGEDEFTVGRPHPMIDFMLRNKRIVEEAKDPRTAVILLDVVLGYGSNMTPGEGRLDFEIPGWTTDDRQPVEDEFNRQLALDHPITVSFLDRAEADEDPSLIRTKVSLLPASLREVRVIDIVGLDRQADGGTHVASTGEVGAIRITKAESKGKGFRRIRFAIVHDQPGS